MVLQLPVLARTEPSCTVELGLLDGGRTVSGECVVEWAPMPGVGESQIKSISIVFSKSSSHIVL